MLEKLPRELIELVVGYADSVSQARFITALSCDQRYHSLASELKNGVTLNLVVPKPWANQDDGISVSDRFLYEGFRCKFSASYGEFHYLQDGNLLAHLRELTLTNIREIPPMNYLPKLTIQHAREDFDPDFSEFWFLTDLNLSYSYLADFKRVRLHYRVKNLSCENVQGILDWSYRDYPTHVSFRSCFFQNMNELLRNFWEMAETIEYEWTSYSGAAPKIPEPYDVRMNLRQLTFPEVPRDLSRHDTGNLEWIKFDNFKSIDVDYSSPEQRRQVTSIKVRNIEDVDPSEMKEVVPKEIVFKSSVDPKDLAPWVKRVAPNIESLEVNFWHDGSAAFTTLKSLYVTYHVDADFELTLPNLQYLKLSRTYEGDCQRMVLVCPNLTEISFIFGRFGEAKYCCPRLRKVKYNGGSDIRLTDLPSSVRHLDLNESRFAETEEQWHFKGDILRVVGTSSLPPLIVESDRVNLTYQRSVHDDCTSQEVFSKVILRLAKSVGLGSIDPPLPLPANVESLELYGADITENTYLASLTHLRYLSLYHVSLLCDTELPALDRLHWDGGSINHKVTWSSVVNLREVMITHCRENGNRYHFEVPAAPNLTYLYLDHPPLLGLECDEQSTRPDYDLNECIRNLRENRPPSLFMAWIGGKSFQMFEKPAPEPENSLVCYSFS
ncbi:hypothetical protein DICA4_F17832 [Diutina catenulata]